MATILYGKPVAERLCTELKTRVQALDVPPALATVRVGADAADESYARGIEKRCELVGVRLQKHVLAKDAGQTALENKLRELNCAPDVHGILLYRPLPEGYDERAAAACIGANKDVDCMTDASLAGVYLGSGGFAPCTPEACLRILAHYGVEIGGKHAVVLGRSAVVGRPLATLLLRQHATVTVCHSRTQHLAEICRTADILIAAVGKARFVTADFVKPGATVLDVGIHRDNETQALCGDVDFDAASAVAGAITPVPGGVGSVTSTVLIEHVVQAAFHS